MAREATVPRQLRSASNRAPCDFTLPAGQDPAHVECGYLTVPEDRVHANGRAIKLAVVVLKATGADPVSDPVVMLSGGPGDPALAGFLRRSTAEVAASLQAKRDLVFFDQRGTGRSEPALQCPEYNATLLDDLTKPLTAEQDAANVKSAVARAVSRR